MRRVIERFFSPATIIDVKINEEGWPSPAEGDRLESGYTGNRIEGSNPSPSDFQIKSLLV